MALPDRSVIYMGRPRPLEAAAALISFMSPRISRAGPRQPVGGRRVVGQSQEQMSQLSCGDGRSRTRSAQPNPPPSPPHPWEPVLNQPAGEMSQKEP